MKSVRFILCVLALFVVVASAPAATDGVLQAALEARSSASPHVWSWLSEKTAESGPGLAASPAPKPRCGSDAKLLNLLRSPFQGRADLAAPRPLIVGDDAGSGLGDVQRSLYDRFAPGVRGRADLPPPMDLSNPNGWTLPGPEAADPGSPTAILFRMVSFDTRFGEPPLDPRLTAKRSMGTNYFLIQFTGPILQEWKDAVASKGFDFVNYIANYAFIVRSERDPSVLLTLPFVRWVGAHHPAYKLNEFTAAIGQEFWAEIRIFPGVDPGPALWELDRLGLRYDIENYNDSNSGTILQAYVLPEQVASILQIPDVDHMDHRAPNELHNYSQARQMRSNRAWSQYRNSLGRNLTGKGQIIGYLDTGVDTGSTSSIGSLDFSHYDGGSQVNKIVYAANAAGCGGAGPTACNCQTTDVCGHGTAGAGAAAGSGRLSELGRGLAPTDEEYYYAFAGSAPQARLAVLRGGGDGNCRYFCISPTNDWPTLYTQNARIINNSWGPVPSTCSYSTGCFGSLDLPTFGSSFSAYSGNAVLGDQFITGSTLRLNALLVNSSGNQGNFDVSAKGSSSCGWNPYGYGTSGGTAVSKNSLSGGAAAPGFLDRAAQQGEVAFWSSKGPAAWGMSKPDIVANGSWSHLPRTFAGATYDISTCNGSTTAVAYVGGECANWGFPEAPRLWPLSRQES
jgi:hypothetical protein